MLQQAMLVVLYMQAAVVVVTPFYTYNFFLSSPALLGGCYT